MQQKIKKKYVNTQSRDIGTALHVIAYNRKINEGHKKSAKLIIDNGTSPYLENDPIINKPSDTLLKGSYLDMAKKRGNKGFLEFMSSLGYSATVPSNSKNDPQNTKKYVVAASALAITVIALGAAVAVYLEMLYQNPLLTEQIRNITNSFNSSTGNIDNKITQNIFK
ncbi:TomO hydrophobic C-terminal domain-containing protein [Wolbachia endosymbiont of Frankliniella intonsa]|uniref:TomO hydrophobic C-terminal domain-containing protein n=1 Tax=Wolbachia endosymbiont of Frankliniella intonsa TaxID=2902422 RepID=UPI00244EBA6B|nr:hypothetical protein [Wolbachia endosymbiont of Frankliniella intonsa]WGJ62115.1 hypothetical protein M3L71_07940 [Wolbachia endosymbiont of Frankliniella intonsa]